MFLGCPATDELVDRAVAMLNDWSGGQTDCLLDVPGYYSHEQLRDLQLGIYLACQFGQHNLNANGWNTVCTLSNVIMELLEGPRGDLHPKADRQLQPQHYVRPPKQYPGFVYLVKSPNGAYKIGRTKNPQSRAKTFGVLLPFEIEFLCLIKTKDMRQLEKELHERFATKRLNGEWFELSDEDVEYIKGLER